MNTDNQTKLNNTWASYSISTISLITRADKWSFGICARGIFVTVICFLSAFIYI